VADLVEPVIELFAYKARTGSVETSVEIAPDTPPVHVDRHAVSQVLVNLHQNALHAVMMCEGKRAIRVRARGTPRGEVFITYCDTGPGVPEPLRNRIFEPFFSTKPESVGTGLGLAISRGIARGQGGELVLEADTGSGACFTLKLRAHRAATAPDASADDAGRSPEGEAVLQGLRVLVVDDDEAVLHTLAHELGQRCDHVTCAADVNEAQRFLAQGGYDVILLDVRLPGTSGLEFLGTMRALNPTLARRVVLMSGDVTNEAVREVCQGERTPMLLKPFSRNELVDAFEAVVQALQEAEAQEAQAPRAKSA
jgi:two-component system NtrC family sensor kinase